MFLTDWHRVSLLVCCALAAGPGCTLEGIDLDGKVCPCADGYVCDPDTNKCVDGSSGGTQSGGSGGTQSGGSGGTQSGGSGGTQSGGSGGTQSGGSGGTQSGGSGGTQSGGSTPNGISCGGNVCPIATDKCCHSATGTSSDGTCAALATACGSAYVDMYCDEPEDCGVGAVCCERLSAGGGLQNIQCEAKSTDCTPVGGGASVAFVCNPQAPVCPNGLSCKPTPRGYSHCE